MYIMANILRVPAIRNGMLAFILPVCIVFAGCTARPEGWGVVLWSPDEALATTGDLLGVYESSQLNETYSVRSSGQDDELVLEQWRIAEYKREKDARVYFEYFSTYADLYGVASIDGLRIRTERDAEAPQVYKLRDKEIVKILDRDEQKSVVGEYLGYWYEVLTDEGVRGYTFDLYLEIKSLEELAEPAEIAGLDEFLVRFLQSHS